MAFFKVEKSGCNVRKGLVEVRYDLYLDEKDYNYSAHYVDVPDLSQFDGKIPSAEYDKWLETAPTIKQHNPFCCHFCQFNPDVTDEEILYVGELALDMAYKNWCGGNVLLNKNLPVKFLMSTELWVELVTTKYALIASEVDDYTATVEANKLIPLEIREALEAAVNRTNNILTTDFTKVIVESKIPYSVK